MSELMNRLATESSKIDKVTKTQMCELFDSLCEKSHDLVERMLCDGVEVEYKFIVALYKHFQLPPPRKAKTIYDLINRVMAKDDIRKFLNYFYIRNDKILAADGHRMIIADNIDGLDEGFYDRQQNKVKLDLDFPDITSIHASDFYSCEVIPDNIQYGYLHNGVIKTHISIMTEHGWMWFNYKYLNEIIPDVENFEMTYCWENTFSSMSVDLPESFKGRYIVMCCSSPQGWINS